MQLVPKVVDPLRRKNLVPNVPIEVAVDGVVDYTPAAFAEPKGSTALLSSVTAAAAGSSKRDHRRPATRLVPGDTLALRSTTNSGCCVRNVKAITQSQQTGACVESTSGRLSGLTSDHSTTL